MESYYYCPTITVLCIQLLQGINTKNKNFIKPSGRLRLNAQASPELSLCLLPPAVESSYTISFYYSDMATSPYDIIEIHRPYNHSHQPRRIYLSYLAQMSIFSSKKFSPKSKKNDDCQPTLSENSTKVGSANSESKINPIEEHQCSARWGCLTKPEKEHEEIIETTLPFDKCHKQFKHPLLCFNHIRKGKNVKMILRKKEYKVDSEANFPGIEQSLPILTEEKDDVQEFPDSIDPHYLDTFIREDDAGWNENLSVVEMHEWLPPSHVSLQLLANDDKALNTGNSKSSFEDNDASFDTQAFNPDTITNNIFRHDEKYSSTFNSMIEDTNKAMKTITTPSTVADSSFFSEDSPRKDESKDIIPCDSLLTEDLNGLHINLSNSFDFNDDDTEDAQYFPSNVEVFPEVISPSAKSRDDGDSLVSYPSFTTSWDGDDDEGNTEDGDTGTMQNEGSQDDSMEEITFSCWKFGASSLLIATFPGC